MPVEVDGFEYAAFGDGYCKRPLTGLKEPWETGINADDLGFDVRLELALAERLRAERKRAGPRGSRHIITRSDANIARARELGFTGEEPDLLPQNKSDSVNPADTFAQRLNDRSNTGTATRVEEARFDELAEEQGMTGDEMRARFRGEFEPE